MSTDEILKHATPRPWPEIGGIHATSIENGKANIALSTLAVNTFEKARDVLTKCKYALQCLPDDALGKAEMKDNGDFYVLQSAVGDLCKQVHEVLDEMEGK